MRYRNLLKIVLPVLLLTSSTAPSWAGGGGIGLALGLGALFTADVVAHSYPPYYGYPYYPARYYPAPYYPYNYPPLYAYRAPQPTENSGDAQLREAPAIQSAPEKSSRKNLTVVSDYHTELLTLLGEKLKSGDITKGQFTAEAESLAQMDQEARADAAVQGDKLTSSQERALVQQYQQDYYAISHNFIVHP